MKASIQKQILNNNDILAYVKIYGLEMFGLTEPEQAEIQRRNTFLDKVLNAPISEIDQKAIDFIYGTENGQKHINNIDLH